MPVGGDIEEVVGNLFRFASILTGAETTTKRRFSSAHDPADLFDLAGIGRTPRTCIRCLHPWILPPFMLKVFPAREAQPFFSTLFYPNFRPRERGNRKPGFRMREDCPSGGLSSPGRKYRGMRLFFYWAHASRISEGENMMQICISLTGHARLHCLPRGYI